MKKEKISIVPHIQWHEGMMLSPQHFQQLEFRHFQHLTHHLALISPYHWGLSHIVIDPVALTTGIVRVLELEAVMPDGLILSYNADMQHIPALELDIRSFQPEDYSTELTIFLSMPQRSAERSPVVGELTRFISMDGYPVRDENSPDNIIQIPRMFPRMILSFGDTAPIHCHGFSILKIKYNESYANATYTPPCFYINSDTNAWQQTQKIATKVREKSIYMSGRWQQHIGTPLAQSMESTLRPLLRILPMLDTLIGSTTIAPHALYIQLSKILGHLTALHPATVPPIINVYNHLDIEGCLSQIFDMIHFYLNKIEESFVLVPFTQHDRLFYFKLKNITTVKKMIVGIRFPTNANQADTDAWIQGAVICSDFALESVRSSRITGAKRTFIEPSEVKDFIPGRNMILVEISLDKDFISLDQKLNIFNPTDSDDKRPIEIIYYAQKHEKSKDV